MQGGVSNAAIEHLPYAKPAEEMTAGFVRLKKAGPNPTLDAVLTAAAATGTYNWQVEFGAGFFPSFNGEPSNGDALFQLRDGSGAVRGDASVTIPKVEFEDVPATRVASGTFSVASGDTTIRLWMRMAYNAGTGYTGVRGGAVLAKLKVWRS
jgi:hypothetical protein